MKSTIDTADGQVRKKPLPVDIIFLKASYGRTAIRQLLPTLHLETKADSSGSNCCVMAGTKCIRYVSTPKSERMQSLLNAHGKQTKAGRHTYTVR